ncbi:MAG TPA: hypothetical protein VFP87_01645, partial [Chitinophagaceae bacterium]|nr:hypothetical protein [Chitinophagaceae bacterium]
MRKQLYFFSALIVCALMFYVVGCTNQGTSEKKDEGSSGGSKQMSNDELIKRGNYLMITSGCHDCHSPKKFGPHGEMMLDSSRLLSGHPSEMQ